MEKKNKLKKLIQDLHAGNDEEQVKETFKKEFGHISSAEIAQLEQELIAEGTPVEEIQKLCNVHAAVFTGSITDLHTLDSVDTDLGHPLFVFRKENEGIHRFLEIELKPLLQLFEAVPSENNRIDLVAKIRALSKIDRHYSRKENLFFPYLENKGITGPPKVMWGKDDEIRDLLKAIQREPYDDRELVLKIQEVIEEVESMIKKEDEILAPLLVKNIRHEEWLLIAQDATTIGYAFNGGIEGASPSDAAHWIEINTGKHVVVAEPEAEDVVEEGYIKFPSGLIKYEDLIHMLNTSPQDFTYIDKDDKVRYFSEGKKPVFDRTRTIIGRDVRNCHPPRAVPVVEQMLADFKEGRKDAETRIIMPGTKVLLVRYYAVRNDNDDYIGTLELTEEISEIVNTVNQMKENRE